jgi:hypothetical protein
MPMLPQQNWRPRPYTARTSSHKPHDANLPVGGVDFRTGDVLEPKQVQV